MFLKLQLSDQFIRTSHETMKSFTAQGALWQTLLLWKPSSFSQPSRPERLLTSEALSKGTFIQRMNAGESYSEPLSKQSITWDHFSHICLEFTAEFQEVFSVETSCHHWADSVILLMKFQIIEYVFFLHSPKYLSSFALRFVLGS